MRYFLLILCLILLRLIFETVKLFDTMIAHTLMYVWMRIMGMMSRKPYKMFCCWPVMQKFTNFKNSKNSGYLKKIGKFVYLANINKGRYLMIVILISLVCLFMLTQIVCHVWKYCIVHFSQSFVICCFMYVELLSLLDLLHIQSFVSFS